ncbi:MAG: S9 family peptidase [Gemmatimonadota bacterium]|nr:S9 family peptidase [Gemmatimonadota bacterium]
MPRARMDRVPALSVVTGLLAAVCALAAGRPPAATAQGVAAGEARAPAMGPVAAADTGLTPHRIFATGDLETWTPDVRWSADGTSWTRIERDAEGRTELWRIEAVSGRQTKVVSAQELVPDGRSGPIDLEDHVFSPDGRRILLFADAERVWRDRTRGAWWVFDIPTRSLIPTAADPGGQMFAKFSPDGDRVAFARDGDLWVTTLDTGEVRRLTFDGSATVTNGTSDWVHEEELGLRDAFAWSPDGRSLLYWRFDASPVPVFPLLDVTSDVYPRIREIRYPKAGHPNSDVRLGVLDVRTARTTWIELDAGEETYVARAAWAASSSEILVQRLTRRQDRLDVLLADAATGVARLLFSETDVAWVEPVDDVPWIDEGRRFLWVSRRDGYRHLYLFDRDGRLVRGLTPGRWDVTGVIGVEEAEGRVWFTAASQSPVSRALHRVELDGSAAPELLAGGRGWRTVRPAPDFSLYLEGYSTIANPPRWTLRSGADGSEVRVVEDNADVAARLEQLDLREPEFLALAAADGTPLNGWIVKPRDFDPGRRYPLLLYVYGGPGSQTVTDAWGAGRPDRYLWHQSLARRGVLVASFDGRGTGARGWDFERQVHGRLGQLETADQLAVIRGLAELPWVDPERIGIWGWSYGGMMALHAAFRGGEAVRAAISVAPVTDWELYDTIYTERYLGLPAENPDGYRAGSPIGAAARLRAALLLVHGTADDNVHPQHSTRLAAALTEADRPFRMHLYPDRTHAIEGPAARTHLFNMMTEFVLRELAAFRSGRAPGFGTGAAGPSRDPVGLPGLGLR